jgi:NAD(P) transhydrogenase subunit beta
VVATLVRSEIVDLRWIAVALVLGAAAGVPLGLLVPMTAVPQRTALSHAFGALAAGLVGVAEYTLRQPAIDATTMTALGLEILLGFLTVAGSLVAFGKLQGLVRDRAWVYRGQNVVNLAALAAAVTLVVLLVVDPSRRELVPALATISLLVGVMLVVRIGGADMPTVISLLNGYAGLAAAAMGFVLESRLLIVAGALDGSSGFLLAMIMCRAMHRSFTEVLFGAFGARVTPTASDERPYREVSPEETAMMLDAAQLVIVVPGYGMAAAQAQHVVRELSTLLGARGVDVRFAIHPVAGRMPGHMNVLLAEANVPYERLFDLDQVNDDFAQADVALVVGANDVVNPAARTDPGSPIYGMPILNVDAAHAVIVVKRSMRTGFAGVDNELFYLDKTQMLFGDAKQILGRVADELERLPARTAA